MPNDGDRSLIARLKTKLFLGLALGALVYLVVVIYAGWEEMGKALAAFPWIYAPLIFGLALGNYFFRFLKWEYYLKTVDIRCSRSDSLIVFFSGLTMVISPGKVGELLKSYLLKKLAGVGLARSMPIIVAERLTDFIALLLISLTGIGFLATGENLILLAAAGVLGGFILAIGNRRLCTALIRVVEKLPLLRGFGRRLHTMYDSMSRLLKIAPLFVATFWSLASWACECLAMYLVIRLMGGGAGVMASSFIYAFGTVVGAVSPGGLGITDGVLIASLQNAALMEGAPLSRAAAGAATLIIRMATLWFAVALGGLVMLRYQKRFSGLEAMDEDPGEGN